MKKTTYMPVHVHLKNVSASAKHMLKIKHMQEGKPTHLQNLTNSLNNAKIKYRKL